MSDEDDERSKFSKSFNANTGMDAINSLGKKLGAFINGTPISTYAGGTGNSDKSKADAMQRRLIQSQTADEQ